MICRVHCCKQQGEAMKKLILTSILCLVVACGKQNAMQFCEGTNKDGEGVRCGTKFESGDLTALVRSEKPFESASIKVDIYRIDGKHDEKIESLEVQTRPEETRKAVPLSLYQGGKFRVRARKGDYILAEGEIEIIEN
jgi:hypothetical protein